MPNHALVVVSPDWDPDKALGFSAAAYQEWHDKIEAGMRLLIYKSHPISAIVGEGESHGIFAKLADWPTSKEPPKTAFGVRATYVMPLRVLYMRTDPIPFERVKQRITDPAFPDVEILPVAEDDYHILTNWP